MSDWRAPRRWPGKRPNKNATETIAGVRFACTSLDHLLDLDRGIGEIHRVLAPNGELLTWVAHVPGAKEYDPAAISNAAIDEFHLFHFDRPWFEKWMSKRFRILECVDVNGLSFFYRMRPK